MIKEYGALICVTVTTCRKAVTIVLSFTLFSKPFVFEYEEILCSFFLLNYFYFLRSYLWSGLLVVLGIYLNVYSRNQQAFDAKIASFANSLFGSYWWSKSLKKSTTRILPI